MLAIRWPKFIITIGEIFFPDKPIHKQTAKLYCIKLEGKAYEIRFIFLRACIEILNPQKNSGRQPLHEAFNSGGYNEENLFCRREFYLPVNNNA